jgi:hypothetical protein
MVAYSAREVKRRFRGKRRILPYYFGGGDGMKRQGAAGFVLNGVYGHPAE